jgi:hypothetical protein
LRKETDVKEEDIKKGHKERTQRKDIKEKRHKGKDAKVRG